MKQNRIDYSPMPGQSRAFDSSVSRCFVYASGAMSSGTTTASGQTIFSVLSPQGFAYSTALSDPSIVIGENGGDPGCAKSRSLNCVHYGSSPRSGPENLAVSFSHTYTTSSPFPGQFQWVQTISSATVGTTSSTGTRSQQTCINVVDVEPDSPSDPIYDLRSQTSDSPLSPLLENTLGKDRIDNFVMTLMFQPASGISVPLAKVVWSWAFNVNDDPDPNIGWTFSEGVVYPPPKLAASPAVSHSEVPFPSWSGTRLGCIQ